MEKISSWASQIIIAVIIGTLIEMILPKGNNKKYIKTVIGIYILFTILSPVITNAFKKNLELNMDEYQEYFENTQEYQTLSEGFSKSTNISIEDTYVSSLKQDIETKLNEKGYSALEINLEVELQSEERYGYINKMEISITNKTEEKTKEKQNTILVNKVEIGEQKPQEKTKLSQEEKAELSLYLSQEYGIQQDCITIN